MADHGKNRRRSNYARKRQRSGKMKKAVEWKERTEHKNKLRDFWNGLFGEVTNDSWDWRKM